MHGKTDGRGSKVHWNVKFVIDDDVDSDNGQGNAVLMRCLTPKTFVGRIVFSECICSRDGEVSFVGVVIRLISVIASVVLIRWNVKNNRCFIVFLISRFCCVFEGTSVSEFASMKRVEF